MEEALFVTKRFFVRLLKEEDQDSFFDMQGNPNVMRFIKKTMSAEESKEELKRFIRNYQNQHSFFKIWAIIENEHQQFLGICGVYKNNKSEYEIAYRLRECFWGQGFGKEIAKGLIQYCFEALGLNELTGYASKENVGSIKILAGEMNFVKEFYPEKGNMAECKYILNKNDWLRKQL